MYNVKLLNKIAAVGTNELDAAIYNIGEGVDKPEAIMVRSAVMHDMEFGSELLCIARAGAGVNNIPIERCAKDGIVVFNTPGANANGVKELTICALLLAARKVTEGVEWAKTLKGDADAAKTVEKGKSAFGGTELFGKTLGVIGLGAIGGKVANTAVCLGMKVIGCDPYLSENAAKALSDEVAIAADYDEIFKTADYITLHIPATPQTKNLINADKLAMMKNGVKLINLSRADLVNAADIKAALESGKLSAYVTDFPTPEVIDVKGIVAIPHLGASTEESEDNCAVMAAHELDEYIRFGNIKNSVNLPNLELPTTANATRICVICNAGFKAVKETIEANGNTVISFAENQKGDYAYAIADTQGNAAAAEAALKSIGDVIKVRIIK